MPHVLPLAGLRYAAESAQLPRLIAPPYDVIGPREAAELRAQSPHNAIYLELPTDDDATDTSTDTRYAAAAKRLQQWRSEGVVRPDAKPTYYLSETEFAHAGRTHRRRDLLAALAAEPWSSGSVLPHEHTMSGPKADRLELLRATHLNASPIWVLFRDLLAPLERAWQAAPSRPPTAEFSWRGEHHRLWTVDDEPTVTAISQSFRDGRPLYIADGHHRFETSLAFRAEAGTTVPGAATILATVTWADDPGLLVLPTHRVLQGFDGTTLDNLARTWSDIFEVQHLALSSAADVDHWLDRLAEAGQRGPAFGVYGFGQLDGWTILTLRGGGAAEDRLPRERSAAWRSLDVSVLHSLVLEPLLATTSKSRDEVLSFERDALAAVDLVRTGRASATLLLNPTPVKGVLDVADAGDRMPEKSTYFYPKPPAGLVMRDLDARP